MTQSTKTRDRKRNTKKDKEFIDKVYKKFNSICFNCGGYDRLCIDHHYPSSEGGKLTADNSVLLCIGCNSSKKNQDPSEFYTEEQLEELRLKYKIKRISTPQNEKIILHKSRTAYMMGISIQAFSRWEVKPVKKKGVHVFYDLREVIAYRSNREEKTSSGLTSIKKELLMHQTEKKKLEVEKMKGSTIDLELHERVVENLFAIIRTQVLALPSKLTPLLQNVKTRERHKIITESCRGVLSQAADNIESAQKAQRESVGN